MKNHEKTVCTDYVYFAGDGRILYRQCGCPKQARRQTNRLWTACWWSKKPTALPFRVQAASPTADSAAGSAAGTDATTPAAGGADGKNAATPVTGSNNDGNGNTVVEETVTEEGYVEE